MGKKVSKLGYPYFVKLDEEQIILLEIEVGIKNDTLHFIFPINVKLTKDKPVCYLEMHFRFDDMSFCFWSYYQGENVGLKSAIWTNRKKVVGENVIFVESPTSIASQRMLLYSNVLTPYPQAIEELMI